MLDAQKSPNLTFQTFKSDIHIYAWKKIWSSKRCVSLAVVPLFICFAAAVSKKGRAACAAVLLWSYEMQLGSSLLSYLSYNAIGFCSGGCFIWALLISVVHLISYHSSNATELCGFVQTDFLIFLRESPPPFSFLPLLLWNYGWCFLIVLALF